MTQDSRYAAASKEFLAAAFRELDQGDLPQASEKGWGAAAQMVKGIAQQRGWPHDGHAYLFQGIRQLADETGENQIVRLFHIANSLHTNFYENWIPSESVREGIEAVGELLELLERSSP